MSKSSLQAWHRDRLTVSDVLSLLTPYDRHPRLLPVLPKSDQMVLVLVTHVNGDDTEDATEVGYVVSCPQMIDDIIPALRDSGSKAVLFYTVPKSIISKVCPKMTDDSADPP